MVELKKQLDEIDIGIKRSTLILPNIVERVFSYKKNCRKEYMSQMSESKVCRINHVYAFIVYMFWYK